MTTRRKFLQAGAVTGAGILGPLHLREAWAKKPGGGGGGGGTLLDAATHPKFVIPLPIPARIDATGGGRFDIQMRRTSQSLGLFDNHGDPLITKVWGYGQTGGVTSYPGPTFVARRDVAVDVRWDNRLPTSGHLLPLDDSIHLVQPIKKTLEKGNVPLVTHLHGGHTESASDGLPEAWFTQRFAETGPTFVKQTYRFDNSQEAATLWYHDHALGITRLNVYAGLAGFYLLRDANEDRLIADNVLPSGPYEIEIVVQDRMFDANGELFFPSDLAAAGFPGTQPTDDAGNPLPSVLAEFFGDFNLVNGVAWPLLDVEPRKYRFRLLNGSDSRFYVLKLSNGQKFLQVGTEDGLLEFPVEVGELLIAPGERADLVVDFTNATGQEIVLQNLGPDEPFKGLGVGAPADPATTGQVMQFRVNQPFSGVANATVALGAMLRQAPIPELGPAMRTRRLALFEGFDDLGRLQPLLGIVDEGQPDLNGSLGWFEPITENPGLDDVEIWEIFNATEDAHPIHLHLVAFQILNRQRFRGTVVEKPQPQHDGTFGIGGVLTVDRLMGRPRDPEPNERGLKDMVVVFPGEMARVIAKFDRPGRYVWHCHILSHEDHEMMRPYHVG